MRYPVTIERRVLYVEIVTVDATDQMEAEDKAMEVARTLKTDGSTFKLVGHKDSVGQVLDINV